MHSLCMQDPVIWCAALAAIDNKDVRWWRVQVARWVLDQTGFFCSDLTHAQDIILEPGRPSMMMMMMMMMM
jgi:hypothetical protein